MAIIFSDKDNISKKFITYQKKSLIMAKITLYQFEQCPFCAKVRAKLEEMGLDYEKVNVPMDREDPQRKDLFEKSGVHTVPVIKIDDKYVGESEEIIKYLEENLSK